MALDQQQIKKYRTRAAVAGTLMIFLCSGLVWNTLSLYAPGIIEEFQCSRNSFYMTMTVLSFMNSFISLFFFGWIQSKLKIRTMIGIGLVVMTIGLVIFALSPQIEVTIAGSLIAGLGISLINANGLMMALDKWYADSPGGYAKVYSTGYMVGRFLGIFAVASWSFLIGMFGWRIPMWITIGICVVFAVITLLLYKDREDLEDISQLKLSTNEEDDSEGTGITRDEMLRRPRFWAFGIVFFIIGVLSMGGMSQISLLASDIGMAELGGTALSVAIIGNVVSGLVFGPIIDKFGSKWCIAIALALNVVGMLLILGNYGAIQLYIASFLFGCAYNAALLPTGFTIKEIFGTKEFGKKVGLGVGFAYLGTSFSGNLMAVFYDNTGSYDMSAWVFIIGSIVFCILMWIVVGKAKALGGK